MFLNQPYTFSAETVLPSQLRLVPRRIILWTLEAKPELWSPLAREIARRHYEMVEQLKKSPQERFLNLLLRFAVPVESQERTHSSHHVGLINQQLADLVGISERRLRHYLAEPKAGA